MLIPCCVLRVVILTLCYCAQLDIELSLVCLRSCYLPTICLLVHAHSCQLTADSAAPTSQQYSMLHIVLLSEDAVDRRTFRLQEFVEILVAFRRIGERVRLLVKDLASRSAEPPQVIAFVHISFKEC